MRVWVTVRVNDDGSDPDVWVTASRELASRGLQRLVGKQQLPDSELEEYLTDEDEYLVFGFENSVFYIESHRVRGLDLAQ